MLSTRCSSAYGSPCGSPKQLHPLHHPSLCRERRASDCTAGKLNKYFTAVECGTVCCIGSVVNERREREALHYTISPTSCTCLLFFIILSFCFLLLFFSYSAFSPYSFPFHPSNLPLVFLLLSFLHNLFPEHPQSVTNSTFCLCFPKHIPFYPRVCFFFI